MSGRRTPGPGGPGGWQRRVPWSSAGRHAREAALVGLLGLAVYGLMPAGCLLAYLVLRGPAETLGPDGMWRPLAYTFGLKWPVGTVVVLVDRRARGGTGCARMVRGWWAGVRLRVA